MAYRLRHNLSCCWVDGHVIFLDIENDQYFRLPKTIEQIFLEYSSGKNEYEVNLTELINKKILTEVPSFENGTTEFTFLAATHSAVEQISTNGKISILLLSEVFNTVFWSNWKLKHWKLKKVIDHLTIYRRKKSDTCNTELADICTDRHLEAANAFRRARLYVPIETSCLLDSLAMTMFLERRQLRANLIFGVTCEPFSAHCWVQTGNTVLNDTVGNANSHTPIRRV